MSNIEQLLPNARPVDRYLEYLACPICKSNLELIQEEPKCVGCGRKFDISQNKFPFLLPTVIGKAEWEKWKLMDDEYLSAYKEWSKEDHLSACKIYDDFFEWCGIKAIKDVNLLDVGGGNGVTRMMYWHHPEKINYFNVDPKIEFSHPFYEELYPKLKQVDFPYIVGIGEYLPFKPNMFDLCITTESVDHWNEPVIAFHEIYRCLKSKKKFYLMVPKHDEEDMNIKSSILSRAYRYYRKEGVLSLSLKVMEKISRIRKPKKLVFEHMHNYKSAEDVTKFLYMFKVLRTKMSSHETHIFIECVKE